jgi:hypothetical protein
MEGFLPIQNTHRGCPYRLVQQNLSAYTVKFFFTDTVDTITSREQNCYINAMCRINDIIFPDIPPPKEL